MFKQVSGMVTAAALITLAAAPMATAAAGSAAVPEWGYAVSCGGVRDNGDEVHVDLYTNNTIVVPADVAVREGGGEGRPLLVAAPGGPSASIEAGRVVADVPLATFSSEVRAGTAKVRGTYRFDGPEVRQDDAYVDEGARVHITGTYQRLATDLHVKIDHEWVALRCGEAFRFTRQITSSPLA